MEDFVTFEIAKKLKAKGFREECLAYYHTDGELLYNRDQYRGGDYKSLLRSYNSSPKNPIGCEQIDASTITQVLKWLREEKKIWICVNPGSKGFNISIYNDVEQYYNNICDDWLFDYTLRKELYCYKTYEEAALAGIEYVLDNLI